MLQSTPLIFELKSVSNLIKRRIDQVLVKDSEEDLTGGQGAVIGYLSNHADKDVYQKDIEEAFGIRRSTVTGTLKLMEKSGYLERHSVPQDARLKKLVLTQKGMDRHQRFIQAVSQVDQEVMNGLTEIEKETLMTLLQKIRSNCE